MSTEEAPIGGGDARTVIVSARDLVASAGLLHDAVAAAERDARQAVGMVRAGVARERLAQMPLERLREATEGRLRLSGLEDAGITTVGAVLSAGVHVLEAKPGVGPQTARQAVGAARQLEAALETGARVRIDADARPPAHGTLLRVLWRHGVARGGPAQADARAQAVLGELRDLITGARPAEGRVRMFLTRGERRREVLTAAQELALVMERPDVASLGPEVRAALQDLAAEPPAGDALWDDFIARAVDYNTWIDGLEGGPGAAEGVEGFLPAQIAERVHDHALDTSLLKAELRGYQAFGAKFALAQEHVILGDEMGLGKTVQALASMCHLAAAGERHFLVVCPASVVANWLKEIPRHTHLVGHRLHGDDRDAARAAWVAEGGIGVTTFETARALPVPSDVEVALLVVDEAHYIKNPSAQRTKAVAGWIGAARRAVLMSGTPMENRVDEFAVLVGHIDRAAAEGLRGGLAALDAEAFRTAVGGVYLRRNQVDVLSELPPRIDVPEWVTMDGADLDAYRTAVAEGNFMAMRRAAYAPGDPAGSAKLERLVEIAGEAAEDGLKVVVFSFFLDVLDAVARAVGDRVVGPLTGALPPAERQELVDRFTAEPRPVVLVSQIQAGGVGLNIQAASVVILTEPQWKPSTEDQAIARAHRMGQARTVQVHRLLAEDSVDEAMRDLVAAKAELFDEYARPSALAEASADATDVSNLRVTRDIASQADAERAIIAGERERLGLTATGEEAVPL